MSSPSTMRSLIAVLTAVPILLVGPTTVVAQRGSGEFGTGAEVAAGTPWYAQSLVAAAITLVVGGLLIAVSPDRTRRRTDRALEYPVEAGFWGIASLIGVIGTVFLLAITVIGLVLAYPLLIAYVIFALVAGEYGFLAVGRLAVEGLVPALAVAVVVSAVVAAVPVLGSLLTFAITSVGMGTVLMELREGAASRP